MKTGRFALSIKHQLYILLFIAIGLNANTLINQYALDDEVVMTQNKFVEKGIKGIPEIFRQSYFKGYEKLADLELSGGRYRPIALTTFALEHQFFGSNPFISHLINILLFAILIALLYQLLQRFVFQEKDQYLAFISCLLFAVHPIHTEVIANVKGRDEITTFIFLIVSLTCIIKYIERKHARLLLGSLFLFFLALLTKETAVTFIGVVLLILYFFFNQPLKKLILVCIPFLLTFFVYLLIRYMAVGFKYTSANEIFNAPFLNATSSEEFATQIFILVKYLWLLIFPHPLSSEYGFNQIPYIEIMSFRFIGSFLILVSLFFYGAYTFRKKSVISFCILYFIITISLVANFIVDIGTPLSERLLFQPSLAFCIAAAFFFLKTSKKSKSVSAILLFTILVLFSIKTIARNSEWKNNEILYSSDVISCPNSARLNLFAAEIYRAKSENENNESLKNEYLQKAIGFGEKALKIYPSSARTYVCLGFAYFDQCNYDKAAELCLQGYKLDTTSEGAKKIKEVFSDYFYKKGNGISDKGDIDGATNNYLKAIEFDRKNVEAWYNLGRNYYLKNDTVHADDAWKKVKNLDQNHKLRKEDF